MNELTQLIIGCPMVVHACVVSRKGYLDRYYERYGQATWEMMKSAFSILIERSAKFTASRNGALMVYYEKIGKKEDSLIEGYFNQLRKDGHPFRPENADKYSPMSPSELSESLRGIEGGTKNRPELQLADLCLYPVVRSKDQPENLAYIAMREHSLLVDCLLAPCDTETIGVKYYCFDEGKNNKTASDSG